MNAPLDTLFWFQTNLIVFGLIQSGLEPMIYRTGGMHPNHLHHRCSSYTLFVHVFIWRKNMMQKNLIVYAIIYNFYYRYTQAGILKNLTEIPAFCQHLNLKKKILFSTKNSDNRLFKYAHRSVSCLYTLTCVLFSRT